MNEAYLLAGGNMNDRLFFLSKAKEAIEKNCGNIIKESSVYETAAWGIEAQQSFLNQALHVKTELSAQNLLTTILKIEETLGRKRELKYGPRTIDIDILLFNEEVIDVPGLKIPHPQMQYRRFVLEPLNELAAEKIHPVLRKTIHQLLQDCADTLKVNKI